MSAAMTLLPGLALVAVLAVAARLTTVVLPETVSEISVGVMLGIVVANTLRPGASFGPGTRFAVQRLLRAGIVLLGARLTVDAVLATGVAALLLILACAAFAFAVVVVLARVAGIEPRLAVLLGVGTAICGNSAIVASAPIIRAEDREVSFAVATITLFGVAAVLAYPVIGALLGLADPAYGHWVGVAVNDTSQVTAAGFAYSTPAGETATIVKLTRNLLIGPVLIGLALAAGRGVEAAGASRRKTALTAVPLFVVGFVAMAAVSSTGVLPETVVDVLGEISRALILAALVAVGLGTDLRSLRRVGPRPLYVGLAGAASLALFALLLVTSAGFGG